MEKKQNDLLGKKTERENFNEKNSLENYEEIKKDQVSLK